MLGRVSDRFRDAPAQPRKEPAQLPEAEICECRTCKNAHLVLKRRGQIKLQDQSEQFGRGGQIEAVLKYMQNIRAWMPACV